MRGKEVQLKWIEKLKDYAKASNIDATIKLLSDHKQEIKELRENHSKIIEFFYSPYAIAYDKGDIEFCSKYENVIDQLTGVESALFLDE